jgi:acyl-CoA synthetase (AMP-forming)/AMP-acid ligase II
MADSQPSVVLLTSKLYDAIESNKVMKAQLENMDLVAVDKIEPNDWSDKWRQPEILEDDIAFLQYTSGSTTAPRGVMVSHSNLSYNMGLIEKCYEVTEEDHGVIWLPPYHDMGLIGGLLQPLFSGISVTFMSHLTFLQRPLRWLQAVSKFKATHSGGPNFAYDLCVKKIRPEQRELIDLSSWKVAFNGAEPVYHKTLEKFSNYFAPCGFSPEVFLPCYGLAESTLMVTGGLTTTPPLKINLAKSGIERNRVVFSQSSGQGTTTLVSCGQNMLENQKIIIVNTETLKPCQPNEIGEVWLCGPCVTKGYWNKPLETRRTFDAKLSDSEEGPFLRSGDLGFILNGELFITGRIKNLIISDGKNHYPHDIEKTILNAHRAIWPSGCAVFSISSSGYERIIVIVEVKQKLIEKPEELGKAIRYAVSVNHGLNVDDIVMTNLGSIPRTTSGKIKHFLCRKHYLSGVLKEIELV